jgi:putative acetyltransferase
MLGKLLDAISGGHRRRAQAATPAPEPATDAPAAEPDWPTLPFEVRPLEPDERARLPELFRASIRGLAHRDYDPQQLQDWAGRADRDGFLAELDQGVTVVALEFGRPVAFAQLAPLDYLNMLYVHPDSAGEGMATLLFQYLEDEARIAGVRTIRTRASRTARRFLAGAGFRELDTETLRCGSSEFEHFRMEKQL